MRKFKPPIANGFSTRSVCEGFALLHTHTAQMKAGKCNERFDLALLAGAELSKEDELPAPIRIAALRVLAACTAGWSRAPAWDPGSNSPINSSHLTGPASLSKFHMDTLTGGMTNVVFRCEKVGGINRTVLLRVYGQGTDEFFSRENEMVAFRHLASLGLGPQLLGEFADGRVEVSGAQS
jgi:Choline/ethanolamine kinase